MVIFDPGQDGDFFLWIERASSAFSHSNAGIETKFFGVLQVQALRASDFAGQEGFQLMTTSYVGQAVLVVDLPPSPTPWLWLQMVKAHFSNPPALQHSSTPTLRATGFEDENEVPGT